MVKTISEDSSNAIDTPSTVIGDHVWFNGGVYASDGTHVTDLPSGRIVTVPYFFGHRDSVYGTAALRDSEVGVLVDQTLEGASYYFTKRVVRSDGDVIFGEEGQQSVQSVNYQGGLTLLVELAPDATLNAKSLMLRGACLARTRGSQFYWGGCLSA